MAGIWTSRTPGRVTVADAPAKRSIGAGDRIYAGIASAALNLLLLAALLGGLTVRNVPSSASTALVAIVFPMPTLPPHKRLPPRPPRVEQHRGGAAPAAARSTPPRIDRPRIVFASPTVPSAPGSGSGSVGAAEAGNGSGGVGNGTAGVGQGDGDGGGSDAEWIGGRIGNGDYPRAAVNRGAQGTVISEIAVGADGRVTGCRITRSSGDADLDSTTCRLVIQRFRFRPATDAAGQAIADSVEYDQEWTLHGAADGAGSH